MARIAHKKVIKMNVLSISKQTDNHGAFMASFGGEEAYGIAHNGSAIDAIATALCIWGLDKDYDAVVSLDDELAEITFDYDNGDYGIHDGFFNAVILIDENHYYFQCCVDDEGEVDLDDCGYNWGICEEVNSPLANILGWPGVLALLERALKEYRSQICV